MLCKPNEKKGGGEEKRVKRSGASYEAKHESFFRKKNNFNEQYAPTYFHRLEEMRSFVMETLKRKGLEKKVVEKLLEVKREEECIVVGTLFKKLPLLPSILDEYATERGTRVLPKRDKYLSDKDVLLLEDETGRTVLVGETNISKLVTGLVVGVEGKELASGEFQVSAFYFPQMPLQNPLPPVPSPREPRYVAIVSGLHLGDEKMNPLYQQLLLEFVGGDCGSQQDLNCLQSKIVRVVIAGNSVFNSERNAELKKLKNFHQTISNESKEKLSSPLKTFDLFLSQLCSRVEVDLMPGEEDPASHLFPQQPFNPSLFHSSSSYPHSLSLVTNPHSFLLHQTLFLGTSGQNINNLKLFTLFSPQQQKQKQEEEEEEEKEDINKGLKEDVRSGEETVELMKETLKWRHIAPTCPDTLPCYPFTQSDPFILSTCPHVYFVGNQSSFKQVWLEEEKQKVKIICVPSFEKTHTIVLVDIDTLDSFPLSFHLPF